MNNGNQELILNGMMAEEVGKYYQIHLFTDLKGPNIDDENSWIFIPKVVCRIEDNMTVAVQEWYVRKKNLLQYARTQRTKPMPGRTTITAKGKKVSRP